MRNTTCARAYARKCMASSRCIPVRQSCGWTFSLKISLIYNYIFTLWFQGGSSTRSKRGDGGSEIFFQSSNKNLWTFFQGIQAQKITYFSRKTTFFVQKLTFCFKNFHIFIWKPLEPDKWVESTAMRAAIRLEFPVVFQIKNENSSALGLYGSRRCSCVSFPYFRLYNICIYILYILEINL